MPQNYHPDLPVCVEDTAEFFNLVLQVDLTDAEKSDLVAYLRSDVAYSSAQGS